MKDKSINKNIVPKNKKIPTKKDIIKRINIIEGQICAIKQMLDKDENWDTIVIQISAASKSLKSVGNALAEKYLFDTIHNNLNEKEKEKLITIVNLLEKFDK